MMAIARELTAALRGRWHGRFGVATCPAHDDRQPSLSIGEGRDGRLLLKCFAGCSFGDVLAALRGRGLVEGNGRAPKPDPATEARRGAEDRRRREKSKRRARAVWAEAGPVANTLG